MPSANKTLNYDLNQWAGNEYPMRTDFVEDNAKVDAAIKGVDDKAESLDQRVQDIEVSINTPETLSTSVTLFEQLKTFLDSYASPSDFRIGGASLYQAVVNGDFANGGTGWTTNAGWSFTTGKATFDGINNGYINQSLKLKIGDKIGIAFKTNGDNPRLLFATQLGVNLLDSVSTYNSYATGSHFVKGTVIADATSVRLYSVNAASAFDLEDVMLFPLTGTPYESYTTDQMNALVNDYFEGLQSAEQFEVGSRGKQLFDGIVDIGDIGSSTGLEVASTTRQRTGFYKVKPSTQYIVTPSSTTNSFQGAFVYDKNKQPILDLGGATSYFVLSGVAFTTPPNAHYVRFRTTEILTEEEINTIMFYEGSTALPYEPYQGSLATVTAKRHKLPNLTEDTLEFVDGRWRFVKKVQEYALTSADIQFLTTTTTNIDYVVTKVFTDNSAWDSLINKKTIVGGFNKEIAYANRDLVGGEGNYFTYSDQRIYMQVAKGTYPNLAAAQADLVNTPVLYQLATPIIIDEADFKAYGIDVQGSLSSNLDYTEFFVNDYDLFTEPSIDYAGNLSQAVVNLKEGVKENKDSIMTMWGKVIQEVGSNENGEYIRFADGTQICSYTDDLNDVVGVSNQVIQGVTYYHGQYVKVYPAAFISNPVVAPKAKQQAGKDPLSLAYYTTSSSVTLLYTSPRAFNLFGVTFRGYIAIGRWK